MTPAKLDPAGLEALKARREAALEAFRAYIPGFRACREQYLVCEQEWLRLKKEYETLERALAMQTKLRKVAVEKRAEPTAKQRLDRVVKQVPKKRTQELLALLEGMMKKKD